MAASRTRGVRKLAPGTRALCAFAAAMARRDTAAAARSLGRARRSGVKRRAAEETALMLMLYAGYPAALEGLRLLGSAWPGRAQATDDGGPRLWRERGRRLCARVYGPSFARLVPAVRALHPDLATWMVEHGYGRVLSRPGLPARERELVTVAALAALGWERQLVSHLLGALRVHASVAEVGAALATGARRAGPRERARAAQAWRRLLAVRGTRTARSSGAARAR